MILIHPSKEYLRACLEEMRRHLEGELKLEKNVVKNGEKDGPKNGERHVKGCGK